METSRVNPILSIIIPMYNVEQYIGECIDSILSQTFKNFELLIVDDCSTDNSAAIVKSYNDPRISYFKLDVNSGTARYPRLYGAKKSKCSLLSFVDADDLINDVFYEELFETKTDTNADIVMSQTYYFEDNISDIIGTLPRADVPDILSGREAFKYTIGEYAIGGKSIISKEKWIKVVDSNRDSQYLNSDEIDDRLLLLSIGKIAFSEKAIYYYRMQPESITHVFSAKTFGVIASNRQLYEIVINNFDRKDSIVNTQKVRLIKSTFHYKLKYLKAKKQFSETERRWIRKLINDNYNYIKENSLKSDSLVYNIIYFNRLCFSLFTRICAKLPRFA